MTKEEFSEYLDKRLQRIKNTLDNKGNEYANTENVFINFERSAAIRDKNTKEEVMLDYAMKHLVSVIDIIDNPTKAVNSKLIEEKFGDLINYLILIEASLLE